MIACRMDISDNLDEVMNMEKHQLFIDGRWQESLSGQFSEVINPATEEVLAQVSKANAADVDKAVSSAKAAFTAWNLTPVAERAAYVEKLLAGIEAKQEQLVATIVAELGCSYTFASQVQVPLSMNEMRATLGALDQFEFETTIGDALVIKEGAGVVACVTPWNYPLNQIQRKITPALLAGNTVVVKPASDTPLTALLLAEIVEEAGLPAGVFNLITGSGSEAGDYLAGHPDVAIVSFTGSTDVGKGLYTKAANNVKKLVLELGGKSALIYLPEGDLDSAVKKAVDTILNNQGQTCSALTRLLVPKSEEEAVKEKLKAYYESTVVIGDPTKADTMVGPMVSANQRQTVLDYLEIARNEGAEVLVGGSGIIDRPDFYVEPTIFVNVSNDMRIAREEIFGPVLVVIPYETVEEAIEIANDSPYGLSGAVVGPEAKARQVAMALRTGNVYVNDGARNPLAPFGGYKESGIGRENGLYGVEDYVEIKTIFM